MCSDSLKFHFFLCFPWGRKGRVHKSLFQKQGRQLRQQQLLLLWDKRSLHQPLLCVQIPWQNTSPCSHPAPMSSPGITLARCFTSVSAGCTRSVTRHEGKHERCKAPANPVGSFGSDPASFQIQPCKFWGPFPACSVPSTGSISLSPTALATALG